jgi:hypothetical protein
MVTVVTVDLPMPQKFHRHKEWSLMDPATSIFLITKTMW